MQRWLSAARHPGRHDGVIALAFLVLPWVLVWALARHHHLDANSVTILLSLTIPLAGLWLTWAGIRNASRSGPGDDKAGGVIIGQVVYQQRRGVTGKPVRLADPPPLLAGREELLAELDTRLTSGDNSGPRTVALCGLGGVGKTSVALAYAHRHLAEVGAAWRFAAEDPTVLAAGFAELAAQLGALDVPDMRDPVASVHGTLAAFPERWLLIFDNAPDRAAVEGFLPPAGRGRVLVTSRNPNWPPGQVLDVPVLGSEVAADFLVSRTGDQDEQAATDWPPSWAGCRWRWSRPPRTSRPALAAWPATWRCSGSGGPKCWPAASPSGMTARSRPPGRWRSGSWNSPRRKRPGCCGCWRSARRKRSRCACCCKRRRGLAERCADRWRRCGAAAGGPAGCQRRHRRAAPVFAGHLGRGRVSVGAPAGAGCHRRSDALGGGQSVAAGRCRPDRGRDSRRYQACRRPGRLRAAAAPRPGSPVR